MFRIYLFSNQEPLANPVRLLFQHMDQPVLELHEQGLEPQLLAMDPDDAVELLKLVDVIIGARASRPSSDLNNNKLIFEIGLERRSSSAVRRREAWRRGDARRRWRAGERPARGEADR